METMTRSECVSKLHEINELSNEEIALNAEWIKSVVGNAITHVNILRRQNEELKKKRKVTK